MLQHVPTSSKILCLLLSHMDILTLYFIFSSKFIVLFLGIAFIRDLKDTLEKQHEVFADR